MPLQSSGQISLSDVQTEFTGSNPIGINEYYRGGIYVPDTAANANIPTSGTIQLDDFYGGDANAGGGPTYSVSPASSSVNEGSSVTCNVTTSGVSNGTTLYWTISHTSSDAADFVATSGSFVINTNAGSFTVSLALDYTTEGPETFAVQVRTGSTSGTIVATSTSITINDTSVDGSFGSMEYNIPGVYTWTCPPGISSVSAVCIGGGGGGYASNFFAQYSYSGGAGGGLGWRNNISVTPGNNYTVVVGSGGAARYYSSAGSGDQGVTSYFINTGTVAGFGGQGGAYAVSRGGGGYTGNGGGIGGNVAYLSNFNYGGPGGGGAGGYSGDGGRGGYYFSIGSPYNASNGSGGSGAGGGGSISYPYRTYAGGGVAPYGEGTSGSVNTSYDGQGGPGGGGSLGGSGYTGAGNNFGSSTTLVQHPQTGGGYGAGGGGGNDGFSGNGGGGCVRIVWGTNRLFPSTNVGIDTNYQTFTITPSSNTVTETQSVTFSISMTETLIGETFYWTLSYGGGATSADINSSTSGSFVYRGGESPVPVTIAEDAFTESGETIQLELRTGSTSGPIVATSSAVTIEDISVSVTPSVTTVAEGSAVTFTISSNLRSGTLYYTINPLTTTSSDFFATSSFFNTDASGGATLFITAPIDDLSESDETYQLEIRTGSISGTIRATSDIITVTDTPLTGTVTPSVTTIGEGGTVNFTVTTNATKVITLYYTLSGTVSAEDFTSNSLSGSFSTNINGDATVGIGISLDALSESGESFAFELRSGSISGPILATSSTVTIEDPSATLTPSATTISEGSGVTFTVSSNLPSTTLYYTINHITTSNLDFTSTVSGSFTTNASGAGSFSLTTVIDDLSESNETFEAQVRLTSTSGTIIGTSPTITVTNTTLTGTVTPSVTTVAEGQVVSFSVNSNATTAITLYYTLTGTAVAADFVSSSSGSFVTNSAGDATVNIEVAIDVPTDGSETFQFQLRSGSTSGTILSTSTAVTITDVAAPAASSLAFKYYAYGSTIGTFTVHWFNGTTLSSALTFTANGVNVTSLVGQQQTATLQAWRNATCNLSSFVGTTGRVVFRYVTAANTTGTGDFQLDDIVLRHSGGVTNLDPDLRRTLARDNWQQSKSSATYTSATFTTVSVSTSTANFWNYDAGGTPTTGTSNTRDAQNSSTGYYIYAESSSPNSPSVTGWLRTASNYTL